MKRDSGQDYAPYTHGLRNQISYASIIRTDYAFAKNLKQRDGAYPNRLLGISTINVL